jgi:hypothetical protein
MNDGRAHLITTMTKYALEMSQELIVSHQYVGVNDGDMNNESIEGY